MAGLEGPARFRRPRPLTVTARAGLGAAAALVFLGGAVALWAATDEDRGRAAALAEELDRPLAPRGGPQDRFDGSGALDSNRPDALPWRSLEGTWTVAGGVASPEGSGRSVATVDAGRSEVVLDALVLKAAAGSGLVVADDPTDRLELVVDDQRSGWQVVRTLAGQRTIVQLLPGPTADVVVQVLRRGNTLRVSFGRDTREVVLPGPVPTSTHVGLVGRGDTEVARFAYLPLDPS